MGSVASEALDAGKICGLERTAASIVRSTMPEAREENLRWKAEFIMRQNLSGELLHFARPNLPQSSGAAQPHVTVGIPMLQLLKNANHAFEVFLARPRSRCDRRGCIR